MANVGLGVTIGSHSLRAVKLRRKGAGFQVLRVFADRLDDTTRPVAGRALAAKGFGGAAAMVGLTGRDVIIRYSQVPPVPDWRLRNLMKFEVEEVGSQSGGDVSADYRKLNLPDPEGTRGEDTILVALARNRHLDALIKSLAEGGLKLAGGCPNGVALFNAFAVNATYTEAETSLLVNVGAEDLDIAIQRGGDLIFARNATPGGKAFTDAIAHAFSTTEGKAEQMKLAKADVTPKGQARYPDSTAEKVANSIMGVAGQLASLIQSTLMIARAQTKVADLKVDRVLLAGGGASLKGLDLYLKQAMGVPVERFNPFVLCDLSALNEEEKQMIESAPHEFAVSVGLAQTRLSPSTFVLEVLPAALRRRRDFATKGVFSVGAAVVMAAILFVLYQGRTEASSTLRRQEGVLKDQSRRGQGDDQQLRGVLGAVQESAVKHQILSELAVPGALLGKVLAELEKNLKQEIYIHSVRLKLAEQTNEFPYVKPRTNLGTGYEKTTRTRYTTRDAHVSVSGRVSSGQEPAGLAAAFIKACEDNEQGLLVDTTRAFRPGRPGQDGEFEIEFWPGVRLEPTEQQGIVKVLRSVELDDADSPENFKGRAADGTPILVRIADVKNAEEILTGTLGIDPKRAREILTKAR